MNNGHKYGLRSSSRGRRASWDPPNQGSEGSSRRENSSSPQRFSDGSDYWGSQRSENFSYNETMSQTEHTVTKITEKSERLNYKKQLATSDYYSNEEDSLRNSRTPSPKRENPTTAYEIYKRSGEWWNAFPKTDYTYSNASKYRYELAPGIMAMPNMSRRSLHRHTSNSAPHTDVYTPVSSLGNSNAYESGALQKRPWERSMSPYCMQHTFTKSRNVTYFASPKPNIFLRVWTYSYEKIIKAVKFVWNMSRFSSWSSQSQKNLVRMRYSEDFNSDSSENAFEFVHDERTGLKRYWTRVTSWLMRLITWLTVLMTTLTEKCWKMVLSVASYRMTLVERNLDGYETVTSNSKDETDETFSESQTEENSTESQRQENSNDLLTKVNKTSLTLNTWIVNKQKTVEKDAWLKMTMTGLMFLLLLSGILISYVLWNGQNYLRKLSDEEKLNENLMNLMKLEERMNHIQRVVLNQEEKWRQLQTKLDNVNDCKVDDIKQIFKEMLKVYDADKTAKVDFALESAGGQVVSTRCTTHYDTKIRSYTIFGFTLYSDSYTPRTVIQGHKIQPGVCWAFQDFPGFLLMKTRVPIHVTGFTIEHAPKSILPNNDMKSAPRLFSVYGLEDEFDKFPEKFGEYEFSDLDEGLQYFEVQDKKITVPYSFVELRIDSNHGQLEYTCLYRFRIHGETA